MTTGARATGATTHARAPRRHGLTPAQWYCLLAGAGLLLAGLFGFIADATFDTVRSGVDEEGGNAPGRLQGDSFLGFEVNGWHNLVHVLSGVVLLSVFRKAGLARTVALAFGLVYGAVTIIGLIDGEDVLGFIPVNGADNVLHLALSGLGIISALMSKRDHGAGHDRSGRPHGDGTVHDSQASNGRQDRRFDREVVAPAGDSTPESRETTSRQRR
jgi:hypothetical protein